MSYWLAIDENLDPHRFRVITYSTAFETWHATEYGTVHYRPYSLESAIRIKPKGRKEIFIAYPPGEIPDMQEMLSLLIFWTAKPLFLAVPASTESNKEQQETLF